MSKYTVYKDNILDNVFKLETVEENGVPVMISGVYDGEDFIADHYYKAKSLHDWEERTDDYLVCQFVDGDMTNAVKQFLA